MAFLSVSLYNIALVGLAAYVYSQSHSIWFVVLVLIFHAYVKTEKKQ